MIINRLNRLSSIKQKPKKKKTKNAWFKFVTKISLLLRLCFKVIFEKHIILYYVNIHILVNGWQISYKKKELNINLNTTLIVYAFSKMFYSKKLFILSSYSKQFKLIINLILMLWMGVFCV